ncbi:MAG: hypothetical protein IJP05_05205 [Oscillospiraceae bacterium]|nr:hypothetical protein [Oscillospiraceae bacterium]
MIEARFTYFENDPLPTTKYDIESNMKKYALLNPGDTIFINRTDIWDGAARSAVTRQIEVKIVKIEKPIYNFFVHFRGNLMLQFPNGKIVTMEEKEHYTGKIKISSEFLEEIEKAPAVAYTSVEWSRIDVVWQKL